MFRRHGTLAVVLLVAACHSSGKVKDAEAPTPDAPAPDASVADGAVTADLATSVDDARPPDVAPDSSTDLAPDSQPDRAWLPDSSPDLAVERAVFEVAVPRAGLKLSFDDCVYSDVGSKPNVSAVSGTSLVAADFDGDGKADVAMGTWPDNHVITLKGKGDGSFKIVSTKVMTAEPRSLCVADLDKNGIPDLLVGGTKDSAVNVLLGRSDGTVADPVSYPGPTVGGIAVGDLDGDGFLDLVVGTLDVMGSAGVLRGTTGSAFLPISYLDSKSLPRSPLLADLDGDGHLDLVLMADSVNTALNNGVLAFRGRGDGSFEPARAYAGVYSQSTIIAGDFTADGILDVVSLTPGNSDAVMLVGKGDGTFVDPGRKLVLSGAGSTWAAADYDLDGWLDLASSQGNNLNILRGNGDGTFASPVIVRVGAWGTMVAKDYDNDGKIDLLVAATSVGGMGRVCAFRNTSK